MDTFKTAAAQGYALLASQYKTADLFQDNFWFGGNAFHTCLTYMISAKTTDTENIVENAYGIYKNALSNPNWWRDDYGWWGNAFMVALNNRDALGYGDPIYNSLFASISSAADYCWRQLAGNWSPTPYGSTTKDNAICRADITGGTYNQSVTLDAPPMQGRNSVTNEGYWLLSVRLAQRNPTNGAYSQAAMAMQSWFQAWLTLPDRVPGAVGILDANGLVLERPIGNRMAPAWYWSGDQGLFIQALFLSNADRNQALAIGNAAIRQMTDPQGILHENLGFMQYSQLTQFEGDYATGKGIFMRGLIDVNVGMGNPFDTFIKQNASAVWCNRNQTTNQFTYNWDLAPCYEPNQLTGGKSQPLNNLIMQAAGQDALNAAVRIAPDALITCG